MTIFYSTIKQKLCFKSPTTINRLWELLVRWWLVNEPGSSILRTTLKNNLDSTLTQTPNNTCYRHLKIQEDSIPKRAQSCCFFILQRELIPLFKMSFWLVMTRSAFPCSFYFRLNSISPVEWVFGKWVVWYVTPLLY